MGEILTKHWGSLDACPNSDTSVNIRPSDVFRVPLFLVRHPCLIKNSHIESNVLNFSDLLVGSIVYIDQGEGRNQTVIAMVRSSGDVSNEVA